MKEDRYTSLRNAYEGSLQRVESSYTNKLREITKFYKESLDILLEAYNKGEDPVSYSRGISKSHSLYLFSIKMNYESYLKEKGEVSSSWALVEESLSVIKGD